MTWEKAAILIISFALGWILSCLKKELWKDLICSWLHRKHRMYCEVWEPERGDWHCGKCHPCDEIITRLLGEHRRCD